MALHRSHHARLIALLLVACDGASTVPPADGQVPRDGGGLPLADANVMPHDGGNVPGGPVILSFSASPANLPAGGGMATLSWEARDADSLSIEPGVGAVTGTSVEVAVTSTTIFTLSATNSRGMADAVTAVVIGDNPSRRGGLYTAMVSPTSGETFTAPASLRLTGIGYDFRIDTNSPRDGLGANAQRVQFFVDDAVALEVPGDQAEYYVFKGFVSGIAAGRHRVWARAIYPDDVLDSEPRIIDVLDPPVYAQTVMLTEDLVVGAAGYELIGSAGARIRLDGGGHRIITNDTSSGPLTLRFVDVFDLGDRGDTGEPGLDVSMSGMVTVEDSVFDSSNGLRIAVEGSAGASIQRNTLRSNMRVPIGQLPGAWVVRLGGSSSTPKVFAANNVGAGAIEFQNTSGWTIGGDTDASSNVLIGPRVGFHVTDSSEMVVRRNYSHHVYFGGWSQGDNFELQGSEGILVEHNVIYDSSWPIRGIAGELRFNLVIDAGHQWLWAATGAFIHHNVFVGGDNDVGGIFVLYDPTGVRVENNTFDGLKSGSGNTRAVLHQNGELALSANIFTRFDDGPTVEIGESGSVSADYNLFEPGGMPYSDSRAPANDVVAAPALSGPPLESFVLDEANIWRRSTTVRDVLALYRGYYTPSSSSPALGAGPGGGFIGAIGAAGPTTVDRFGSP